jgi:hypothetical protein
VIQAKMTTFSGEVKKLEFINPYAVDYFTKKLPYVLPANVSVYFECDLLDMRGAIRSVINEEE